MQMSGLFCLHISHYQQLQILRGILRFKLFPFPTLPCETIFGRFINSGSYILYVWSQYDGANIEQRTIGYGWRQNQEAKLKIVGGVIP